MIRAGAKGVIPDESDHSVGDRGVGGINNRKGYVRVFLSSLSISLLYKADRSHKTRIGMYNKNAKGTTQHDPSELTDSGFDA